jgi:hypothetical protein
MDYFLRNGRAVTPAELRTVKSADRADASIWAPCGRCGGSGYVYAHWVEGGICFACRGGKGRHVIKPCYSAEKLDKLIATADKKAANKAAALEAKKLENLNKSIALVGDNLWTEIKEFALPIGDAYGWDLSRNDSLIVDLYHKATSSGGLSEKAADLLKKVWANKIKWAAEKAEKDATAVDVEEGRYEVTGKILSTKGGYNDYGPTYKMLVDCGDFRVFGSIPAATRRAHNWEELAGKDITFTGTFKAKETGFGFFSRPSKAEITEEVAA